MKITDLLNKLEAAEEQFRASEVLAPVLPGRRVAVRIAGIVCQLRVQARDLIGWAILRPQGMDRARIVRRATMSEVAAYLALFPAIRLIVVARDGHTWYALPAQWGDTRFQLARDGEPVSLLLAEEGIQPFETVVARFDGRFFWYEQRDGRRNPAIAAYLREALNLEMDAAALSRAGLSAEERAAYAWALQGLARARVDDVATRLSDALQHADGRLLSFVERDAIYTVTYEAGSQRYTSNVRKDDLTVQTAGICLSGRDGDFDLTSLVGVMREAEGRPLPRWDVGAEDDE